MSFCSERSSFCLYRITYTNAGGSQCHWDFWAKDKAHAIQSADELLPLGSTLINVYLKEEW